MPRINREEQSFLEMYAEFAEAIAKYEYLQTKHNLEIVFASEKVRLAEELSDRSKSSLIKLHAEAKQLNPKLTKELEEFFPEIFSDDEEVSNDLH